MARAKKIFELWLQWDCTWGPTWLLQRPYDTRKEAEACRTKQLSLYPKRIKDWKIEEKKA